MGEVPLYARWVLPHLLHDHDREGRDSQQSPLGSRTRTHAGYCPTYAHWVLPYPTYYMMIDSGLVGSGRVPQEQKMLKGHLPIVIYHQVY